MPNENLDFVKIDDPVGGFPTGGGYSCSFSPNGDYLAVAHAITPFITIYKHEGDTFTKLPDPVELPQGEGRGASFSPDGSYLAVSHGTTPYITIYKRDGDTFTKLSDPTGGLLAGVGYGCDFSPNGDYLVIAHNGTPYITIYKREGDSFSKLPDPTGGLPAGVGYGCSFNSDGDYLAVSHGTTPFITIYKREGDAFTKLPDPTGGFPSNQGNSCSFSPDNNYLAVSHNGTPFITIYHVPTMVTMKHFIKSDGSIYVLDTETNTWIDTELIEPLTKENFDQFGMDTLNNVGENLDGFGNDDFEVITWVSTDKPTFLKIETDSFVPIEWLNNKEEFEVLTYSQIKELFDDTPNLHLGVPEYRLIDSLERPLSLLMLTAQETTPVVQQEYGYPKVGTRIMKRG